ncbi:MAG TPA: pitrilysin family protein [Pyrinomonadaceae bacterium]|nr:pitrilysin family protein [Pyrinomonadaceae bacterium]HMP64989.1 pitrilysin family protein [Pyrinomonadaceae bacterium]
MNSKGIYRLLPSCRFFTPGHLGFSLVVGVMLLLGSYSPAVAQEPKPGPPREASIPAVKESRLRNGLTVAVIERRNVPLVTVHLLVKAGSELENMSNAGLANVTASMLTKGAGKRTAAQISEDIEFLGGTIFSLSHWDSSAIRVSVTSDKIDQAVEILADVVLRPSFPSSELELLRSQSIDGLTYELTQPGPLTNYVSTVFSFDEHPSGGTPNSLKSITRNDVQRFYRQNYRPADSVLIFAGDISQENANRLAQRLFGAWRQSGRRSNNRTRAVAAVTEARPEGAPQPPVAKRLLVVDLPDSGQASVSLSIKGFDGRGGDIRRLGGSEGPFYRASVLNSLLGGGYSSRLNQEIRIRRGLSYGAGSTFNWRHSSFNFSTRTQTKNESAAEVAQIVMDEVKRLFTEDIAAGDLVPRKAVLTGGFSRNIETTSGLVNAVADLYRFSVPVSELNRYMQKVNSISGDEIREFAAENLIDGDIIIVGEYAKFKDDLAKRFPDIRPVVVPASQLDITQKDLRKR